MAAKHPVSLKQLAKMAQLSTATISRVINNTGRFSEETRERVKALIQETGYVPNVTAKALRTRTARAVGLVIPDIVNEFFAAIVDRMGRFFFERDYSLFVCNAGEDEEKNQALLRNLYGKGVDGLIYISRYPIGADLPDLPVVYLDRVTPDDDIVTVGSDNVEGGRLAARALLDAGSTHPVVLCDSGDLAVLSTINNRIKGFTEVMLENGADWSRRDIILTPMTIAETRKNVYREVKNGRRFDGIFATLDVGAIGAMSGLEDAGLRVPDDVNVVGYDDISFCEYCKPALTTIRQDVSSLAAAAAEALVRLMEKRDVGEMHMTVPVRLVVRDSTRKMSARARTSARAGARLSS